MSLFLFLFFFSSSHIAPVRAPTLMDGILVQGKGLFLPWLCLKMSRFLNLHLLSDEFPVKKLNKQILSTCPEKIVYDLYYTVPIVAIWTSFFSRLGSQVKQVVITF